MNAFTSECRDLFEARQYQREFPIAARFSIHHCQKLERLMKSENRTIRIAAETLATQYVSGGGGSA